MKTLSFSCTGHENISARHATTLEFTKDDFVTPTGDCIVGINADFDADAVIALCKDCAGTTVRVDLVCGDVTESFTAMLNGDFSDAREMVFRTSRFNSERTIGFDCSTSAARLNRALIEKLKTGAQMSISMTIDPKAL